MMVMMWDLLKSVWPNRKGDISIQTIVIIIITIAVLVLLIYIASTKGKGMFDIWGKGPFA
jgi:preprotein translocase subunit SecE